MAGNTTSDTDEPAAASDTSVQGRRGRRGVQHLRSVPLVGLFVLACLYTVAIARPVLLPLAVALMLNFLLSPIVRLLKRAHIPEWLSATIVVLGLLLAGGWGAYSLARPASEWVAAAPESMRRIQQRAKTIVQKVQKVTRTAQQVEQITSPNATAPEVQIKEPSIGATVLWGLQDFLGNAVIVFTLLFFLLGSGDLFLRKIIKVLPRLKDKRSAVEIAREIEQQVSAYLVGTTLINVGFGVVIALMLWGLGMPNPWFWGVVAGATNFVPYLGGIFCTVVLGLAAMLAFDDPWRALLVPAAFFTINTLEGYVVTPIVLGRRLTLNTPVLFVGLLYWWWVWGIPGALLAVPMMATLKIISDRVAPLAALAEFLGDESSEEIEARIESDRELAQEEAPAAPPGNPETVR